MNFVAVILLKNANEKKLWLYRMEWTWKHFYLSALLTASWKIQQNCSSGKKAQVVLRKNKRKSSYLSDNVVCHEILNVHYFLIVPLNTGKLLAWLSTNQNQQTK